MVTSPKANDSSFISKMKSSGRNIVVFYGSQTGTAEEFAARLAKEAARYGMKALIADPEECEMVLPNQVLLLDALMSLSFHQEELVKLTEIPNSMAIFCMATYGEGDPTDNAQAFYEWLQAGDADLTGVNFAVIIFNVINEIETCLILLLFFQGIWLRQ